MPAIVLSVFRFVRLLMSGHQAVAIENAALRLQLAASTGHASDRSSRPSIGHSGSLSGEAGPAVAVEVRRLIARMVSANPLWRTPRIHGERKKLGISISERTVSRILRRLPRPPSQTWNTGAARCRISM
jgi:hypothetical protein